MCLDLIIHLLLIFLFFFSFVMDSVILIDKFQSEEGNHKTQEESYYSLDDVDEQGKLGNHIRSLIGGESSCWNGASFLLPATGMQDRSKE